MSEENKSLPDLSDMISMVSANPKAMAMLSSLLGGTHTEKANEGAPCETCTEKKEEPCLPAPVRGKKNEKNEDRRRLLTALKPFLSPERRQAVTTLLLILDGLSLLSAGKEPPCT